MVLSILLLLFIPLYPKVPLFDIKNTWVNIRVEDFVIAVVFLIFGILLLARKATLKTPLTIPILIFWGVGLASTVYAIIFLFPNLTNVFPDLAVLHYLRRIEYLGLFFIGFSAIRGQKSVNVVTITLVVVTLTAFIYGIGQKFWGFPAFLTGNEEFSKGIALKLAENARIPSTFAGHYDLSAYLVMVIPIFIALIFGIKNWWLRIILFATGLSGYILLLMTASRVSFGALLIGLTLLFIFIKQKKLIIPALIACLLLSTLFDGISERLGKTISQVDLVVDARTGRPVGIAGKDGNEIVVEDKTPEGAELKEGTGYINLPNDGVIRTARQIIYKKSRLGTGGEDVTTIEGNFVVKSGFAYDVSFTTRFQGTWPRAINAFDRNPLTGSGYSTINLASDNNYLRILGEVGIIGFLSFVFIFVVYGIYVRRVTPLVESAKIRMFSYGLAAGVAGLALNAVLIDVFEASKVAFMLWLLMGLNIGMLHLYQKKKVPLATDLKNLLLSGPAIILYFFIGGFAIFRASTANFFVADDFTWLRWAEYCKDTCSTSPQIFLNYFTQSDGFFYRPGTKLYFYVMFSLFSLDAQKYHLVSILLHAASAYGMYLIAKKVFDNKWIGLAVGGLFLTLAINYEAIFWISVTGHMIAFASIIYALVFYIYAEGKKRYLFLPLSIICALISPLFYEIGVITPFVLLTYELIFGSKKFFVKKNLIFIAYFAIIPIYLITRYISGSHWSGGDYSYDLMMLPFNAAGNAIGYVVATLGGPDTLAWYSVARQFLKENLIYAAGLILLFGIILAALIYFGKKFAKSQDRKIILFGVIFFILALTPFLGFGNISPRYDYLAAFGVLLIAAALVKMGGDRVKEKKRKIYYGVFIALSVLFGAWNIYKIQVIQQEWEHTSTIVENFIIYLYDQHPEDGIIQTPRTFYVVNTPAKVNSAWLFPTGIEDMLHFALRNNNIKIISLNEVTDDLYSKLSTTAQLFVFQPDGQIKEYNNEGLEIVYEE